MLPAIPVDTEDSVVTAADAEPIAAVPTENTVITDKTPASTLVLMLFFFIVNAPLNLFRKLFCVSVVTII